MPIAPTLILGLGGTGSKIVEKVAQKVNESENGQSERIAFVVFDTDINDLGRIRRESPEIYTVQTSTRNTVGEYLGINTNARDNWFPVNEMMNRKTLTEGAAQVRAISRLAFDTTLKGGNLTPLHDAIDKLFRIDKDMEEQSLRIMITSSLAGGTGSGITLSVAMYLSNYLKSKFPKAKAITRGFFIQPDVFYKVIPGAEERQNLQVNAYAAIRELDAFLMKGDNTLGEQYKNLKFEFPRVGAEGVEEVNAMPYDFCFLFDANNKDSGSLHSFSAYLDHAATCIYTQSIGPMSKKSNSREDNVLREVIKNDGRNRYAGAGASRLVYPWQHVRDVTGYRWANQVLSAQWLQFDQVFRERQSAAIKQREAGHNVRDLDRGIEFIKSVDSAAANKDSFALSIKNQCLIFDEEGFETGENRWEAYSEALASFVRTEAGADPALSSAVFEMNGRLNELRNEREPAEYTAAYTELNRLRQKFERNAAERAGIIGYTLFKSDSIAVTKRRDAHRLETYLRDRTTQDFIHPVSSRYFLYNTVVTLQDMKTRVERRLSEHSTYFKNFEAQKFPVAKGEDAGSADLFTNMPLTMGEKLSRKPSKEKEGLVDSLMQYLKRIQDQASDVIFSGVLADALEYVKGITVAFEHFFVSLEGNLKRLSTKIEQERNKYDDLTGSTTRYVLATSECLDRMGETMTYSGGIANLDSDLSEGIYNRVREYHMLTDEKGEGFFKDIYNNTILGYFSDQVMQSHGEFIKKDIIEALEHEYRIIHHDYEEDNVRHYVKGEIAKAKKLAAPFIEQPLGEERHPIVACAYNPAIEGEADPKRKALISEELGNYGSESDEDISPQEILFYNAIYGIRASDLGKFAPERNFATEHRAAGEYFTAYYNLVSGIKPSVGETKVITPHVDRRWHSISELPDLDDGNQARQLFEIHKAMLLGLIHKRITWTPIAAESNRVYRYLSSTGMYSDFVVSNGTPCDQFYEVVDALTINPVAVTDILGSIERDNERERSRMRIESFDETDFAKSLKEGITLEQMGSEFATFARARFSVLDVAAFTALSTPAEDYIEELLFAMVTDFLQYLHDDVSSITTAEEVDNRVADLLQEQLVMFAANLPLYSAEAGPSFMRKVRVILSAFRSFVDKADYIELREKAERLRDSN